MLFEKIKNFDEFYRTAGRKRGRHVVFFEKIVPSSSDFPEFRLAVVASKRNVDKRATRRNRARRRVRAALLLIMKEATGDVGRQPCCFEWVFSTSRSVVDLEWGELVEELRRLVLPALKREPKGDKNAH